MAAKTKKRAKGYLRTRAVRPTEIWLLDVYRDADWPFLAGWHNLGFFWSHDEADRILQSQLPDPLLRKFRIKRISYGGRGLGIKLMSRGPVLYETDLPKLRKRNLIPSAYRK